MCSAVPWPGCITTGSATPARAAELVQSSSRSSGADVSVHGRSIPLPASVVRRAVRTVLEGERRDALVSVTFLGRERMRRLNARFKGHDRPTDVLAFTLPQPTGPDLADVYICAAVAAAEARTHRVTLRQELV